MATGWQPVEGGFAFNAGGFTGRLRTAAGAVSTLEFAAPAPASLAWTRLDWKDEQSRERNLQAASDSAYIQEPYAVVPTTIVSDVGLQLTAFVRTSEAGLDLDLRLTTAEPLATVGLEAFLAAPSGVAVQPNAAVFENASDSVASAGVVVERLEVGDAAVAMFVDLGDHGVRTKLADRVNYTFYAQPLERGVILVGRIAWRSWTSDDAVSSQLARWLDSPSSSL